VLAIGDGDPDAMAIRPVSTLATPYDYLTTRLPSLWVILIIAVGQNFAVRAAVNNGGHDDCATSTDRSLR
jgi:hypothetical protein